MDELESADFSIVVPAKLDQHSRCESGYGLVPVGIETL